MPEGLTDLYVRIDAQTYYRTGEVEITSSAQSLDEILKRLGSVQKGAFSITRDKELSRSFRKIHGKAGLVMAYLIDERDFKNQVMYRPKKMARAIGLSQRVLIETIKFFIEEGLLARDKDDEDVLMLHPLIVHRGTREREAYLMKMFEEMRGSRDDEKGVPAVSEQQKVEGEEETT